MKKQSILLLACISLSLSAVPLQAQIGAAIGRAAGRAAVVSSIHALEQQRFNSNENLHSDHLHQIKVIQPDFRSADFDAEFWHGDPVVVANPVLPDGGFDITVAVQLAKSNYHTWRLALGPYVDPEEYKNLRQQRGNIVLTQSDSMQIFYRTLINAASFSTLQKQTVSKIPPQVATNNYPVSRYEPKTGRPRLLYYSLFLYWIVSTFGIWHIFYKADCRPKGYAFIPFWRITGLCRVAGFQPVAALWMLVPVVNIVFWAILHVRLCQRFGVPGWFGLLSLVLPPALWWIIGRSEDYWYQPV